MNSNFLFRFVALITILCMLLGALGVPEQKVLAAPAGTALQFNGTNQYVTFDSPPNSSTGMGTGLGVQVFTIETWFKRTGTGATPSAGTQQQELPPTNSKCMMRRVGHAYSGSGSRLQSQVVTATQAARYPLPH